MEFVSLPTTDELPPLDTWYPWPADRPWLRTMMVMSVDGGFRGADGQSHALSSRTDQRVLLQGRRWAHAVLIGAETMRRERYGAVGGGNDVVRRECGLTPEPTLVVVSASLNLPWEAEAFRDGGGPRPIVMTTSDSTPEARKRADQHADVMVLPGPRIQPGELVGALHSRGLSHIVCEGGPHLVSCLIHSGAVDEADVTVAPLLAGGGQIRTGPPLPGPTPLRLAGILEHADWLFTRYVRQ